MAAWSRSLLALHPPHHIVGACAVISARHRTISLPLVRIRRQDQIHSSIVSTLLALMDGLDSRSVFDGSAWELSLLRPLCCLILPRWELRLCIVGSFIVSSSSDL